MGGAPYKGCGEDSLDGTLKNLESADMPELAGLPSGFLCRVDVLAGWSLMNELKSVRSTGL